MKDYIRYCLLILVVFVGDLYAQPYKNANLPPERRAEDLLHRMTLDEKVCQIRHIHSWNIFDGQTLISSKLHEFVGDKCWGFVEGFPLTGENCHKNMAEIQKYMMTQTRLGIPVFTVAESLHGSVHEGSTIFPQNIALASTFNPNLAYRRAVQISKDLHYQGIRQVLSPCIDVVRDLRWGRVEECYGEDPFLNSLFAVQEVKGYLDSGISPMLKHYGPHGNPTSGLNLSSVTCGVGELHDIYLKPFEKVVKSLPLQAVMSTYNSWNRVPNSASRLLLTDILRHQWGFKGYVYSDWGAIDMLQTFHRMASTPSEAARLALSAGLDVEASSECYSHIPQLITGKALSESVLDSAVYRVLLAKFRMGLFEDPYGTKFRISKMHSDESVALAREIADESTVLLKNEGNLLPLDVTKIRSIAVIGPNADQVQFGDYSWSRNNKNGITPLQGISRFVHGTGVKVNYAKGCDLMTLDTTQIAHAVKVANESDVIVIFCGSASASLVRDYSGSNCGEGFDLSDLSLTGQQEKLIREIHKTGKPVVLVLVTGKPFAIPWEKQHVPAILVQWYAGEQEGNSIADILFGKINPSGHLTVSFPKSSGHLPVYYNYLPTDKGFYHNPGSYEKPGRDYVFSSPKALWAFGHGLSYTSFEYKDLFIKKVGTDSVFVSVTLTNTGSRTGKSVPQLYVRDLVSSVVTPVKALKAFSKVELKPKESAIVPLNFSLQDLAFTDEQGKQILENGDFEIQVGDASDHIVLKKIITIGEKVSDRLNAVTKRIDKSGPMAIIKIKGVVRDVQANPLKEVRIYSGQQQKIIGVTDGKGQYSVSTASNDVLQFQKGGLLQENIEVQDRRFISIKMRYAGE